MLLQIVLFQGLEKHTKVPHGYTSINDVRDPENTVPRDKMESYFLGETLKYLYLLFADRHEVPARPPFCPLSPIYLLVQIDLNQWVFNTEAHLMPIQPVANDEIDDLD